MTDPLEKALRDLCKTSFGRRSFLAALPLLVTACGSAPKVSGASTELSVENEKQMAREALPEIRRSYPACKDADIQNYVAALGARLIEANGLTAKPYDYSFVVVDVPTVNAFALPAGKVYLTAPLLAVVETEAELAGVLGHEVGHVEAHHAAKRIIAQKNAQSESWLYGAGGAVIGGVAGGIGASLVCPGHGSTCAAPLIALAATAGVSAGLLIQKYSFLANSQENELEADRTGFAVADRAGYSAEHIGDFYRRLQKVWEENQTKKTAINVSLLDSMSTHPPSAARVQQIDRLILQTDTTRDRVVSSNTFDQIRKRAMSLGSH